jgi:hypothetical protein
MYTQRTVKQSQREKLMWDRAKYLREYAYLLWFTSQDLRVIKVKGYTQANRRKLVIKQTVHNIDIALAMAL